MSPSLVTWQKALEYCELYLSIVFGTKGGKARETVILNREAVKLAVDVYLDKGIAKRKL